MRLISWVKAHRLAALGVVFVLGYTFWWYRLRVATRGHSSPADTIAEGWMVRPAGITGWLETSPDGQTAIMHDTGYADPFVGMN